MQDRDGAWRLDPGDYTLRVRYAVEPGLESQRRTAASLAPGLRGTALWVGEPLMASQWLDTPLPVVGKLGTPILFDVGVYLVVLGVTLIIELSLAEES